MNFYFNPSFLPQGYMSGGSGYCLSREAIRRLVEIAFINPDLCQQDDRENEDIEVGLCLQNVNVTAIDARDSRYKDVFNPFPPAMHLIPSTDPNFWYYIYRFYGKRHEVRFRSIEKYFFYYQKNIITTISISQTYYI